MPSSSSSIKKEAVEAEMMVDQIDIEKNVSNSDSNVEDNNVNKCIDDDNKNSTNNGIITIDWDENDPENPKKWAKKKKWAVTLTMACITFISPAASSMVAPAAADIGRDLNITTEVEIQLIISVYLIGYAVGPLFLSPMSEIYGRKWVVQVCNAWFLIFNLACGFAQTKAQMIIFRFLTGLGGSAPLSVGGGILGDMWESHERGKAMSLYSLCPVLAPSLGPIAGAFIASNTTWRWAFWSVSIFDSVLLVVAITILRETYAPTILRARAKKLTKTTGKVHNTKYDDDSLTTREIWAKNLIRPFKLLCTQPIIQFLTSYMAYIYGLLYLILTTFPRLWTDIYGESTGIGGLNYISISIGYLLGGQMCAIFVDGIYKRLKKRNNGVGRPEFRAPLMFVSALILPIGLFWYGWSAQARVHWIMPNIGVAIVCFCGMLSFGSIQIYTVDAYGRYAASSLAAISFIRSLCGFGFPLFAPYMYNTLGFGWGNSLLAFIGIAIGIPMPIMLWKWGAELRKKSPYAVEDRIE